MEIREVTDNIAIYSDGQRLQVIHNLGEEQLGKSLYEGVD